MINATSELSKPVNGELMLPPSRNAMAEHVRSNVSRTLSVLPSHVDRQNFAANAVAAANELTTDCEPNSVLYSVFNAARMGLVIGGPLGLSYLVPFKGKCTLIVGYKGFIDLAYSNRFLKQIYCEVVLRGELFRHWVDETGAHFRHDIADGELADDRLPTRENITGAYCVYQTATGRGFRAMSRKQINKVDKGERDDRGKPTVWGTHFEEQVLKTTARRASKYWKLTPQLALAVELEEQYERGEIKVDSIGAQEPSARLSLSQIQDEPEPRPGATADGEPETTVTSGHPAGSREPGDDDEIPFDPDLRR